MRKFFENTDGQAIVEYMLMLAVAATLVILFAKGLRKTIMKLWGTLTREVAAPCPACPPQP